MLHLLDFLFTSKIVYKSGTHKRKVIPEIKNHHTMTMHGKTFLPPVQELTSRSTRFVSSTHMVHDQMGPQAELDAVAKTKVLADASNRNTND